MSGRVNYHIRRNQTPEISSKKLFNNNYRENRFNNNYNNYARNNYNYNYALNNYNNVHNNYNFNKKEPNLLKNVNNINFNDNDNNNFINLRIQNKQFNDNNKKKDYNIQNQSNFFNNNYNIQFQNKLRNENNQKNVNNNTFLMKNNKNIPFKININNQNKQNIINVNNKNNIKRIDPMIFDDDYMEKNTHHNKKIEKNNEVMDNVIDNRIRNKSVRLEDYKKIEEMLNEQQEHLIKKVEENSYLENDLRKSIKKNEELQNKIENDKKNNEIKFKEFSMVLDDKDDEIEELKKEKNFLKTQNEEYKKIEEKNKKLFKENCVLKNQNEEYKKIEEKYKKLIEENYILKNQNEEYKKIEEKYKILIEEYNILKNQIEEYKKKELKEKNFIEKNNILNIQNNDNKKDKKEGLINSIFSSNNEKKKVITPKLLKDNNINEKKVKIELINKLQEQKTKIESELINIMNINDTINEKYNSLYKKFKIIKELINTTESNITQLKELQQVEINLFQNFDPIIYAEFDSLKEPIVDIEININKIDKEIKLKVENKQRDIQELIKNIDENMDIPPNIILEILNKIEKSLTDFKNNSSLFENSVNNLEIKQDEIYTSSTKIKNKIQEFLCIMLDDINDKKKKNQKQSIEKVNEKSNITLAERLLTCSKNFDLKYSSKKMENEDSFNEELQSQKVNFDEEFISDKYEQPELIKKNWTQITTLTEDGGQEVEIYFILKAVGLQSNTSYKNWYYNFDIHSYNQVIFTEINSVLDQNPIIKDDILTFNFNIKNNEEIPIRFKYKSIRKDKTQFYNQLYVGLNKILANRQAKFYLYCPETLTIVKFEENLFEKESDKKWIWEGIVPENGLNTRIAVSFSKSIWELTSTDGFYSNNNITNTVLMTPVLYKGGNNKIISNEIKSTIGNEINGNTIKINKNNKYEIECKNLNTNDVYFTNIITLENSTNFKWNINNEKIKIPEDQKKNKEKFQNVVKEILNNNKSKDSDPVKIGKYVKKIMKYKISKSGKNLTASEILENKEGVCEHYTILLNALLNSVGIDALYVTGNCINEAKDGKDGSHAWTLCKWNNEWIPLDPTWGIFSGKLPVSHIFAGFDNKGIQLRSYDSVVMKSNNFTYKLLSP